MNSPFFDDIQVHRGCIQCRDRISWEYYRNYKRPLCIECARSLKFNIALTNLIVMVSSIIGPSLVSMAAKLLSFQFTSVSFIATYFIFAAPYGWTFLSRINRDSTHEVGAALRPFASVYRTMQAISIGWIVFPYEMPLFIRSFFDLYKVDGIYKRRPKRREEFQNEEITN